MSLTKEAIEKIQEMAGADSIEVPGGEFIKNGYKFHEHPTIAKIKVSSLKSFADASRAVAEDLGVTKSYCVVESFTSVVFLMATLDAETQKRPALVRATFDFASDFEFNQYMRQEDFLTKIQQDFMDTDGRKMVTKVVGTMSRDIIKTSTDDGITQSVVAADEVGLKERGEFKNPVMLLPYRTFKDIAQPMSPFILRFRTERDGEMPKVALFEMDHASWKLSAMESIANYLNALGVMPKGCTVLV